jgi:TolB protein
MNADGTGLRRLSQGNEKDFSPSWSPDGNWIAFASSRGGQTNIYMMDTRGGSVTQLTKTGADHPAWSR